MTDEYFRVLNPQRLKLNLSPFLSYKLLFSHAALVRDLLRGFVQEDWVNDLDLTSLEKVSTTFIADDLREREDDTIWRVRYHDSWVYIYILIEFQSTVDRFMAVRLMTYIGLLYQDLIRTGQLLENSKLPPVFPLVLYNGEQAWTGATAVEDLIATVPGGLSKYRPTLSYLLLDESRHPLQGTSADNLVATIFRLERSRSLADIRQLVQELIGWLKAPEQLSLRRSFAIWIRRVLLPVRLPGQGLQPVNDLNEVDAMLAERVKEWTHEWEQKGRQEGEAELLLRLIRLKFGDPDTRTIDRIRSASAEQLLLWSEHILTANTLEEIFSC